MCLRKALLQVPMLVRENADSVLVCFRHALPIFEDNEREKAGMVLI